MKTELIYSVDKVTLKIQKSNPPVLIVTAVGTAASGSHQDPTLVRRNYPAFPRDGIQEYDFNICIPEDSGTTDTKRHTVQNCWHEFPLKDLKGVRVFARMGSITEVLEGVLRV